jgi:predicted outer membrane lipoprotein
MISWIINNPVPLFGILNTMAVEHLEILRQIWAAELVAALVTRKASFKRLLYDL